MRVGSLFSGAGLLDCGLAQTGGFEHAWLCEADEFRRGLLARRFPDALILDDIRELRADALPDVDLIAGGFPCKGVSTAGKREGFGQPETVLWREMRRVVGEARPRYVLIENVANILALHDGAVWGEVLGDLAALGFDAVWDCLPAASVGAPHLRDRVLAIATHAGCDEWRPDEAPCGPERANMATGGRPEGADQHRAGDHGASPDADGAGRSPRRVAEPQERGLGGVGRRRVGGTAVVEAAADANGRRREERAQIDSDTSPPAADGRPCGRHVERLGLQVEWGVYEPAIRRWEAVHGPAPAPLTRVRGMDDGDAKLRRLRARVDRSRLSALGDGVHVYLGRIAGERILAWEARQMSGREG